MPITNNSFIEVVNIFTDGNTHGFAFFIPKFNILKTFRVQPCTSVLITELLVIKETLCFSKNQCYKFINIFSDSKSVLSQIKSNKNSFKLIIV